MVTTGRSRLVAAVLVVGLMTFACSIGATSSDAAGLKFRLSPKVDVPAGKRVCFTGVVRGKGGKTVVGAKVNLDGTRTRSKRGGKVRVCKVLGWPGRHAAHAQKGRKSGFAYIKAKSFGVGAGGTWVRQELQLPAFPSYEQPANGCQRADSGKLEPDFATDSGSCFGLTNPGTDGIFSGRWASMNWRETNPGSRVPLTADASQGGPTRQLNGYLTSEAARIYYITSGQLDGSEGKVYSGTDPSKAGGQGGPFLININLHRGFFGVADGYTFHTLGWVFKEN